MLLTTGYYAFAEETEPVDTSNNNVTEAEILSAVGVMDVPDTAKNWDDIQITNSDFIIWAFNLSDFAEVAAGYTGGTSELAQTGEACFGQYAYAEQNGWFPDKKEEFKSGNELSAEFAAIVLEGVLGYRRLYAVGITSESERIRSEVLSGVKTDNGLVNMNGAIKMIYNATDIDVPELTQASDSAFYYEVHDGVNVLVKNKKIYKIKGRVNATELASLAGARAGENRIVINDLEFVSENKAFNSFIGQYIKGYAYVDGADMKVLYLMRDKNTDEIVIDGDKLDSFKSGTITYYDENDKKQSQKVDNPTVIYNGKELKAGEYNDKLFDICDGTLTLIMHNGKCNTVIVTDYKNIVVGSVNSDQYTIYDMFDAESTLKVNTEENSFASIKNTSGNSVAFEKLKKGDVITYIASLDGEYVDAVVGGSSGTGAIKRVDTDGSGRYKYITVGDKQYSVSKEMRDSDMTVTVSKDYTYYVNYRGYFVGVKTPDRLDSDMGYMLNAWLEKGTDIGHIKVVPSDAVEIDQAVTLKCADKVKIDGKSYKNSNIMEGLDKFSTTHEYPIAYELNKAGELTSIDTPYYDSSKEEKNTLTKRYSMEDEKLGIKGMSYWGYRNIIGGKYYLSYGGLCIMKPAGKELFIAERMKGDASLNLDIYTFGSESPVAYFAVVNDDSEAANDFEQKLGIIDEIYTDLNDDGEIISKVKMIVSLQEVEYEIEKDKEDILNKIDEGDFVRFKLNAKNNIIDFVCVLDYSNMDSSMGYMSSSWKDGGSFRITIGKAYDYIKDDGCTTANNEVLGFYSDENDKIGSMEPIFLRQACVYKYTWGGRGEKKITAALSSDIRTFKNAGADADYILITTEYAVPLEIYIISPDK